MSSQAFKVGTRNSQLALTQTKLVTRSLEQLNSQCAFDICPIVTTGDYRRDKLNLSVEDKKQWVVEIERRLLTDEIDFAIHSAKDVPLNIEPGTVLIPVLDRKTAHDVLLIKEGESLKEQPNILNSLPMHARIGTSSKRRKSQLLYARNDIDVVDLKGNINSRIEKLLQSDSYYGIILAEAGINRLSVEGVKKYVIPYEILLPAVGQGQLVAQVKENNEPVQKLLSGISDKAVRDCFVAERKVVELLEADCHSALGVYAEYISADSVRITTSVFSTDGGSSITNSIEGKSQEILDLSIALAQNLIGNGAKDILAA